MTRGRIAPLLLALCAGFAGSGGAGPIVPSASAAARTVVDDFGRRVVVRHSPARIVSIAPGATEMLFAAGGGGQIVATVEFSDAPEAARRVPRIGDSNAIDMERLAALRPDVVVVWPGGNNPAQIARIERLAIPLYRHQVQRLADLPPALERLGQLAGTSEAAHLAAESLRHRLAGLEERYRAARPMSVLLQIWDQPIYTIGRSHLLSDALRLCGARNVFDDLADLSPVVDVEAVVARDPQVIVAVALPGMAGAWLERWRRFPALRAVRADALVAFEDPRLTRLGPSALDATEALCGALERERPRLSDAR